MIKSEIVANTDTILLEVPIGTSYATTCIFFCNNSDIIDDYIYVYFVKSGELVNESNRVVTNLKIKAEDTFVLDIEKIILSSGDKIIVNSRNGGIISATVSYIEI